MKHFFLISNHTKDPDYAQRDQAFDYLTSRGAVCVNRSKSQDKPPQDTECVIILGGDGTMLRAIRQLADSNVAFIGINTGHIGYLTEGDTGMLTEILDALLEDRYIAERRIMIYGKLIRNGRYITRHRALNDIVVSRSSSLKEIKLNTYVDDLLLCRYRCDGLIVSTPTGSTAYNFSAGGPIVEPTAKLFAMTPIASHSLNNRSLVFSSADHLTIEVAPQENDDETTQLEVYFDGDKHVVLEEGDRIEITQASTQVTILKLSERSFVDTLRIKLSV